MKKLDENKKAFLLDEVWMLAWGGSVQRNRIFQENASDLLKKQFQKKVRSFIEIQLLHQYQEECAEKDHVANIGRLSGYGSRVGLGVLHNSQYRFATAQKLLNLLLKYHWCLGYSSEPPHCPIDREVINNTELCRKLNWTGIDNDREYKEAIAAIRKAAGNGRSISRPARTDFCAWRPRSELGGAGSPQPTRTAAGSPRGESPCATKNCRRAQLKELPGTERHKPYVDQLPAFEGGSCDWLASRGVV